MVEYLVMITSLACPAPARARALRASASVTVVAIGLSVMGCQRQQELPQPDPDTAIQTTETPRAALSSPGIQKPSFTAVLIRCETRPATNTPNLKAALMAEAKTVPDRVSPGAAPELRVRIQHGPAVQQVHLNITIDGRTQKLTGQTQSLDAPSLESELAVKFPALPNSTLVRYWVEVVGPAGALQRFPGKVPGPSYGFYVQQVPKDCRIPFFELKIEQQDLPGLEQSAIRNNNSTVPGVFIADGQVYDGVRVRYRGSWARTWPKKPLKVFFDKDRLFEGQRCLNLNSGWHDPAAARELFAYEVFAACGVPCSKARMVRLHLNGQYAGLYVDVQQPDKVFLNQHGLKGAALYKAVSRFNQADERDLGSEESYRRHYEKQNQKEEGYGDLQQFCRELARASDLPAFFNRTLDIEEYLNYLAATALTQNWDGFNKNHCVVYDRKGSRKWLVIPWDMDRTFGDHWNWSFDETSLSPFLGNQDRPGVTGWNRLQSRFLSNPILRNRFLDRLQMLLEREFTEQKLFPIINRTEKDIAIEAALDREQWPGPRSGLEESMEQVRQFVRLRRAFLLAELPALRGH